MVVDPGWVARRPDIARRQHVQLQLGAAGVRLVVQVELEAEVRVQRRKAGWRVAFAIDDYQDGKL